MKTETARLLVEKNIREMHREDLEMQFMLLVDERNQLADNLISIARSSLVACKALGSCFGYKQVASDLADQIEKVVRRTKGETNG